MIRIYSGVNRADGAKVTEVPASEFDAVVSPTGDVVISSESVRRLALAPGQHVRVSLAEPVSRKSMYGALRGQISDVSLEDMDRANAEIWGELAGGR